MASMKDESVKVPVDVTATVPSLRFEYRVAALGIEWDPNEVAEWMNEMGAQGFRYVQTGSPQIILMERVALGEGMKENLDSWHSAPLFPKPKV